MTSPTTKDTAVAEPTQSEIKQALTLVEECLALRVQGRSPPYSNERMLGIVRTALASRPAPASAADMRAFGASDAACVKWPDDTPEHVGLRAAYCEGAFDAPVDPTEWISRDDHIAAVGEIRAEGVERYLAATSLLAARDKLLAEAIAALEIVQKENERARCEFTSVSNNLISNAIDSTLTNLKAALPPKEPTDAPSPSSHE